MFRFEASEAFWKSFHALSADQKAAVRGKWKLFKDDPFNPKLGTHRINRLTALHGCTVHSVRIEANLRVIFKIVGNAVITIDVGTHDLYK